MQVLFLANYTANFQSQRILAVHPLLVKVISDGIRSPFSSLNDDSFGFANLSVMVRNPFARQAGTWLLETFAGIVR